MRTFKLIVATILVVPVSIITFIVIVIGAIGFGFWSFLTWD